MSADPFTLTDAEAVPRDRYGRPLIVPPGGGPPKAYTRCTTYVGCLEDTYNLAKWQQRMVALGLARRPDLLLAVSAHHDDKKALDGLCEEAREAAAASASATTGTALHRLAERLDSGETVDVPPAAAADLKAYQLATADLTPVHIERITVHDDLKVAGTPDRVVEVGGKRYIADLKTGSIDYGIAKIAMQLALYSRSALYDVATGRRSDLSVDQDRALVIHLPAGTGTCDLQWVDIARGWDAVLLAKKVRTHRAAKDWTTPYAAQPVTVPLLASLIEAADSEQALLDLWRTYSSEWTPAHTERAKARKAELLGGAA